MQLKVLCSRRSSRITKQHPLPCPLSEPSVVPQPQPAAPIVPVPSSTKRLLETDEEKDQPTISIRKPRTDLDEDFQQVQLIPALKNSEPAVLRVFTPTSQTHLHRSPSVPRFPVLNLMIKRMRDNLVLKPRPRPIPKMTPAPTSSLSVKKELLVPAPTKKVRQPSAKPMRIGTKVTPRNFCALDWQANCHQCEPASAFALYWNDLSTNVKETKGHGAGHCTN
ncbi:hypothetical protein BD769DRAFT_1392274 [Suillus cothurnatus]|nr:hypothetical protein BD769DRAFT_1392274 [Suillus cothurnatus]